MPAEFVRATSPASISGKSSDATPADAEWIHRSLVAALQSGRGMPNPRYTSASAMAPSDSSLGCSEPSPADSVSACTTCVVQPAGVALTSRAATSSGRRNAGVRDRRSTTSLRMLNVSSIEHHVQHFRAIEQFYSRDIELSRRPRQHEVEHAIVIVVEHFGLHHAKSVGEEGGFQPGERLTGFRSSRAVMRAPPPQQLVLEPAES